MVRVRWVMSRPGSNAMSTREELFPTKREALRAIDRKRSEVCAGKGGMKPSKAVEIRRTHESPRTYVVRPNA